MDFNNKKDQIAITIPYFRMRKSADGLDRWNEINIATIAIDEKGQDNKSPAVYVNMLKMEHPVKSWERVDFAGSGRLVYGPAQPGAFVYCAVLFIESDNDNRNLGKLLREVAAGAEIKSIVTAVSALVNPTASVILSLLSPVAAIVGKVLEGSKDDILYTQEGIFLRDIKPPYHIGDSFKRTNDFIESSLNVIPLVQSSEAPMSFRKMTALATGDEGSNALALEALAGVPEKISLFTNSDQSTPSNNNLPA
ncbi:hypothetical protein [Cesiribacter sp. SM1]|uniref:hypothetical protein n=1 Tax=Cesiribacter sp. SM1 TaxID=2861196 RepID=UPI001CD6D849|nr:hypothetical protein [Cesiribacter sp. SM1]